jgi:hypothetical protein
VLPVTRIPRKKEIRQRIAALENIVKAKSDGSDNVADEGKSDDRLSSTDKRRPSGNNSVAEFLYGDMEERDTSPLPFEDSLFAYGYDRVSSAFDHPFPAMRSTLFPIGGFKHEKDCKMLLAALKCTPNVREALEKQSHFWARKMSIAEPNSSSADRNIIQYAYQALAGDNPIKIAKIVQAVASVTLDIRLYEQLVLMVDRLIVSDDEYLSNLEGMECALEQGRLLTEMGQIRRSW